MIPHEGIVREQARAALAALPPLELFVALMPGLEALVARRTVEFSFHVMTDGRGASVVWLREEWEVHTEWVKWFEEC